MEIIVQQKGDDMDRRQFKLKSGFYENSAYNDGGVPHHYIIVAWLQDLDAKENRPPEEQEYMDKFYPNFNDGQYFIVLGDTNDEELPLPDQGGNFKVLQEMAIKMAEEKGLVPEYTLLDIFENRFDVSLYGYKND